MPTYSVNPVDGVQNVTAANQGALFHDIAIRTSGTLPSGSLTLTARKPGSDSFEAIPDATFDLSALWTIQATGKIAEFQVLIDSLVNVESITITDITTE
jgi:hypothetical protein